MKYQLVSVEDSAAGAFGRPIFAQSSGAAIRSFSDEVNRSNDENVMFHHPEDFSLYDLGTFDDESGRFNVHEQPILLVTASQVKVGL